MTNQNSWPGEPGYPLNPERSGQHWVKYPEGNPFVASYLSWKDGGNPEWYDLTGDNFSPSEAGENWDYLGPCVPLGEQYAAGYAQGAADAREADVEWLEAERNRLAGGSQHAWCALDVAMHKVEALPLPSPTVKESLTVQSASKPDQEKSACDMGIPDAGSGVGSKDDQDSLQAERTRWQRNLDLAIQHRETKAAASEGVEQMNALREAQALRDFREGMGE